MSYFWVCLVLRFPFSEVIFSFLRSLSFLFCLHFWGNIYLLLSLFPALIIPFWAVKTKMSQIVENFRKGEADQRQHQKAHNWKCRLFEDKKLLIIWINQKIRSIFGEKSWYSAQTNNSVKIMNSVSFKTNTENQY